ncbi:MAG: hypothetical protein CFK49_01090 [Armatimonadetes bacterium JP3_11]|nr:MAG: hypothetical protein CFK49_01090 [Armatimonadetes bacterium JP3_11]
MSIHIYHITHIENLVNIVKEGRLYCDVRAAQYMSHSIAYSHLKRKRKQRAVPIEPKGTLANYVPFYFAPRSPMLYAIHTGYVRNGLSQTEIIYLVTSVEAVARQGKPFVFTDRHPLSISARFSNDLSHLDHYVDWNVMRSEYWCDSPNHPDRKSRRQAEFLVYQQLEWHLIEQIGVYDSTRLDAVLQLLRHATHQPPVAVRRDWYY